MLRLVLHLDGGGSELWLRGGLVAHKDILMLAPHINASRTNARSTFRRLPVGQSAKVTASLLAPFFSPHRRFVRQCRIRDSQGGDYVYRKAQQEGDRGSITNRRDNSLDTSTCHFIYP